MRSIQSPSLHFSKVHLIIILSGTPKSLTITSVFLPHGLYSTNVKTQVQYPQFTIFKVFFPCSRVTKTASVHTLTTSCLYGLFQKGITYCTTYWGHSTSFISKLHNFLYQWPSKLYLGLITPFTMDHQLKCLLILLKKCKILKKRKLRLFFDIKL